MRTVVLERRRVTGPPPASAPDTPPPPGGAPTLQPVTVGLLRAAGVLPALLPRAQRLDGADLVVDGRPSGGQDYAEVSGSPVPYALSVPVVDLVRELLAQLAQTSRVELVTGVRVDAVTHRPDGRTDVHTTATAPDGEPTTAVLRPRWVAACDGKSSAVRDQVGIAAASFPFEAGYLEIPLPMPPDWSPRMRAHLAGHDYVLATPTAGSRLLVVWIGDPREVAAAYEGGGETLLTRLTAVAPGLAPWLRAHPDAVRAARGVPHLIVRAAQWRRDGVVLVGDSAHGLHAMGGQGLNFSLQDAVCTAQALHEALLTDSPAPVDSLIALRRPFIEAFQEVQRTRAGGAADTNAVPSLELLALGQPELRPLLADAAGALGGAAPEGGGPARLGPHTVAVE